MMTVRLSLPKADIQLTNCGSLVTVHDVLYLRRSYWLWLPFNVTVRVLWLILRDFSVTTTWRVEWLGETSDWAEWLEETSDKTRWFWHKQDKVLLQHSLSDRTNVSHCYLKRIVTVLRRWLEDTCDTDGWDRLMTLTAETDLWHWRLR